MSGVGRIRRALVPSMSEAGIDNMAVYSWSGFAGPAGLHREIVNKLHAALATALTAAPVKERLLALDAELVGSSPEEFSVHLRNDLRWWSEVIAAARITLEK